ncbi:MAG: LysR family transcriptional regulator [Alphaproteobacteria bacterium]
MPDGHDRSLPRLPRIPSLDSRLKLSQLRLLAAIGEAGSINQAAALLNLSQPAITKSLRDMEQRFGVTLFERGRFGAIPTVYGRALLRRVGVIMAELRRATDELTEIGAGREGQITVGTLISASAALLPRALARLQSERPRVTVQVIDATNDVLLPSLRVGQLDLVVGRLPEVRERNGIVQERLYVERGCIVARPQHPVAQRRSLTLAQLRNSAWILPPPSTTLHRRIEAVFRAAGSDLPRPAVESSSLLMNQQLLREADLLCVVPQSVARRWAGEHLVRILPLELEGLSGPVGICTAAERPLSPVAARLIQVLRDLAQSESAD